VDLTAIFGGPIDIITRADLLEDGQLVAVDDKPLRELDIRLPVALTRAAWEDCVAWDDEDSLRKVPQDEDGRLWDVLVMARGAARRAARSSSDGPVTFAVLRVPRSRRGLLARQVVLSLLLHQGDNGEPVITISMVGED
jgi:hypothetical protein